MWLNAVKSFLFLILAAGLAGIYLPLFVFTSGPRLNMGLLAYLAIPLWLAGGCVVLWCFWDFSFKGGGTPAPIDPPKKLVVSGLYRYVRNPIYIGVMLILLGHFTWLGRLVLILYIAFIFLAFHLFVTGYEEPNLRRRFGSEYEEYYRRVPRWIPKRSPSEP